MRKVHVVAALLSMLIIVGCAATQMAYDRIEPGRKLEFPRDHYAHNDFRTEWWYYTGILDAEDGRTFGFEIVFFKRRTDYDFYSFVPGHWLGNPVYLTHFAIADPQLNELFYEDRVARDQQVSLGRGGALTDAYHIWAYDWSVKEIDGEHVIRGNLPNYDLTVSLKPAKAPVLHGDDGFFLKDESEWGQHGTYYISYTNLVGEGVLFVDGQPLNVKAKAWMDHEFGTRQLGPDQLGWDWFSLRLDDETELMVYLLKQEDGTHSPYSKATFVRRDGSTVHLNYDDLEVIPGRKWRDYFEGGGSYVLEWTIRVPKLNAEYRVKPFFDDSEIDSAGSTMVIYWEGMIHVDATVDGQQVGGRGYMEICGEAKPVRFLTEQETQHPRG